MNILPQPSLERYLFGKLILQLGFGFFRYIVLLLSHTLYAGITRRCRWSRSWGTSPSPSSPPPTWPWSTQTCSGFSGILSLALDHPNDDPSNEKGAILFSKIPVCRYSALPCSPLPGVAEKHLLSRCEWRGKVNPSRFPCSVPLVLSLNTIENQSTDKFNKTIN